MNAFELGVRGIAQVEIARISGAADALGERLVALAAGLPHAVLREATAVLPRVPEGLPASEHAALVTRLSARALAEASEPHLQALAETCGVAIVAEADRLAGPAAALDVLLQVARRPVAPLAGALRTLRERGARLTNPGADPGAHAVRAVLMQQIASDLGVPRALAALRSRTGDAESRSAAAAAVLEEVDATALHHRAQLVLAPLADLFDTHLDAVFAP